LIHRAGVLDEEIFLMKLQVTKAGCLIALALLTAACGGGGDGETAQNNSPPPGPGGGNAPPTIQGQPGTSVAAGQAYNFSPTANDSNGDTLTFTAANLPSWASLNKSTGAVTGTPDSSDVGTYSGITITVSDGTATASLAAFAITVTDIGTGMATVSWTPPTQNTDGSALALGSYVILYGRSATSLDRSITVSNPSITRYVVENLSSGTWFFAVSAVSSQGASSSASNVATKTI
jgi:hypothetical protein